MIPELSTAEVVFGADSTALLGLDVAAVFYDDMGLGIPHPDRFRAALRELTHIHTFELRSQTMENRRKVAEALVNRLLVDFGTDFTASFRVWLNRTLHPMMPDQIGYFEHVIHAWYGKLRKGKPDQFKLGARSTELLTEFTSLVEVRNIQGRIEEAKALPLSQWDEAVYYLVGFQNDPAVVARVNNMWDETLGTLLKDPFSTILYAVERWNFQRFWDKLLLAADDESLALIRNAAEKYWREPMPHPSEVNRPVVWNHESDTKPHTPELPSFQ